MHNASDETPRESAPAAESGVARAWQSLTGATAAPEGIQFVEVPGPYGALDPAQVDEDNLPMIVWLRGDEPWFEDFSVDAEQAMEELGIRRSRLTQISGRELRVGKKRVDRYIRPVFRPEDIAAYKNFTRATVSHLKSSQVIDGALARLESETGHLVEKVTEAVNQRTDDFQGTLEGIAAEFRHAQGLLLREVTDRVDGIERGLDSSLKAALSRVDAALCQTGDQVQQLQTQIQGQYETILSLINQNHLLLRELQVSMTARIDAAAQNVTGETARIEAAARQAIAKSAEQVEMSIHQTRLAIRADLKKLSEAKREQNDEEKQHSGKRKPWTHFGRNRNGGNHARRLRY
ncbi:MAG: hypothetical protein RIQ81_1320 [Pseudomonadota bacterium]|jgi:hypothetical protein